MSCPVNTTSSGNVRIVNTAQYALSRFHGLHFDVPYERCLENGCGPVSEAIVYPRPSLNHTIAAPTGNPFSHVTGPNMFGVPDGSPKAPNVAKLYYTSPNEAKCASLPKM